MSTATRVTLVLSAILGFWLLSDAHRGAYDFQAFYCAGEALAHHADPYRAQPLASCEHRQTDGTYAALPPGVALPAPQPPYDIALFALFSLLPFGLAKAAWGALLGVTAAVAIFAAARVTGAGVRAAFMAFAASLILPSFAFGQMFALYAAACCLAALFAQRGQWTFAGVAAIGTLVEPHLGLPVCVALVIWSPRARIAVSAGVVALAALSFAAAGWHESVEYAAAVLPLHALSEINSDAQLSLTAVLHALGMPETQAVRLGALSYLVAAAAGVFLGKAAAARNRDDSFVVAVPAAFAIAGGTFIHATEMVAAVPLALLLLRTGRHRTAALIALVLLSIPWFTVLDGGMPIAFAAIAAAVIFFEVWQLGDKAPMLALAVAAVAGILLALAPSFASHVSHASVGVLSAGYPQASWRALTDERLSSGAPVTWVLRAASWAGLLIGCACALASSNRRLTVNVN